MIEGPFDRRSREEGRLLLERMKVRSVKESGEYMVDGAEPLAPTIELFI